MLHFASRIFIVFTLAFTTLLIAPRPAEAQSTVWLQVEAQPTLAEAEARARAYAAAFPNISGFRMRSGWYAIAIGPFTRADADRQLATLRRERLIPGDSFIAFPQDFRQQFWPVGASTLNDAPITPATTPGATAMTAAAEAGEAQVVAEPEPAIPANLPDETPREARRSEAQLTRAQLMQLQEALKWEGFYDGAIDAAFGRGTRNSMAAWQEAQGIEPTGILTTQQRARLIAAYRAPFDALGMAQLVDDRAGIQMLAPMGAVAFDRIEPPFVHYKSTTEDDIRLILISQAGDQNTLFGLYDIMQTLEIVPPVGERDRRDRSFTLTGQSADLHSHTHVVLTPGGVKGFTLAWKPGNARVMGRIVTEMRESFTPTAAVLPYSAGDGGEDQRIDLMAGLEIRTPEVSRSGFYVNQTGSVLTTTDVLGACRRVTLDNDVEADVTAKDDTLGLALLTPRTALTPLEYARFAHAVPRLKSEVAVAGYSYEEVLSLPTLTYGTLDDIRGLEGQTTMQRLDVPTLPGDAGGPVFDASGAVLGMLLARDDSGARKLPDAVQFAANVPAIAEFLSSNGLSPAVADDATAMAPEDLTLRAEDITVLVSCWK